jgi:hypothetical protein
MNAGLGFAAVLRYIYWVETDESRPAVADTRDAASKED